MEMVAQAQWWFFWMGAVFASLICFSIVMLLPSQTPRAALKVAARTDNEH
jgi:hypothetical protein